MEEIKIFFEQTKLKTKDEFILDFEQFITKFEDKNQVIKELIKLYRNEKAELSKKRHKQLEDEYMTDIYHKMRIYNRIIAYLKSQKEVKEEIEIKPKKISKKETKFIKKEKKKKIKEKIIFLPETLELVSLFERDNNIILELNDIIELIKYYQYEKDKNIRLKIELQNKQDTDNITSIYSKIRHCNKTLEYLVELKKQNQNITRRKLEKTKVLKLPVSNIQIKQLDDLFGIDTIAIIESVESTDEKDKLNYLYNIYDTCKKKAFKDKMALISRKRKLKKTGSNDTKLNEELIEAIKQLNIHMDILNNLINYLKPYKLSNKTNSNTIFQDEVEINQLQEIIEYQILNNKIAVNYELNDILYALGHIIKYKDLDGKILEFAKEISNGCLFEDVDEEKISGIYYVWDTIKYRLSKTKDLKTRKILKDIRILFDFVIKNYKEDETKEKHDYLFNVVDYLLKSEDNILYLKKLIEKLPKIVNVRHLNKNKESEHIVIYIVDKFIANYRKMLNKDKYYISKDYLKAVYLMFTRCYLLYLTKEEKSIIDKKLANFMGEVNRKLKSSRRKNAVKEDLRGMYTDKFYMHQKRDVIRDINDTRLENAINSAFLTFEGSLKQERIDLTSECSITLRDKYNAYSIEKIDDKTILKIHVIDLYDIFPSYSTMDSYLFNLTLTGEEIDPLIEKLIYMQKGRIYPTITYEIVIDEKGNYKRKNGHVDKFRFYKSKIKVQQTYSNSDLSYSNGDIVLKSFRDLYRNVTIKNHMNYNKIYDISDMTSRFEEMLNQGIIEHFKFNGLPFIYSGKRQKNNQEFIIHMNNIGHILSRLEKTDFEKVYSVLKDEVDEYHYSHIPFNGQYDLSVKNPLSYPGVLTQRILHELVLDNKNNEDEYKRVLEQYRSQAKEAIMYFNHYIDYFDADILKENKGKIKKITKILF